MNEAKLLQACVRFTGGPGCNVSKMIDTAGLPGGGQPSLTADDHPSVSQASDHRYNHVLTSVHLDDSGNLGLAINGNYILQLSIYAKLVSFA